MLGELLKEEQNQRVRVYIGMYLHPCYDQKSISDNCSDRGGTFCDCIGIVPGKEDVVLKLLSVDPGNYDDAPSEGIRRILELVTGESHPRGEPLDVAKIGEAITLMSDSYDVN